MATELLKFALRINDDDGIDIEAFKQAVDERGGNREELVRGLIRQWLNRLDRENERYYTIKGWDTDHKQDAYIHNLDGSVSFNSHGIEWQSREWNLLEHAVDLVERSESGDKEAAIKLFHDLFGESNVFVKNE